MRILDGILQDVDSDGEVYLIHIKTGEKVQLCNRTSKDPWFIRSQITKNDLKRAEEVGIHLSEQKLSEEQELEILKKMAKSCKERFYTQIHSISFGYETKPEKYVV